MDVTGLEPVPTSGAGDFPAAAALDGTADSPATVMTLSLVQQEACLKLLSRGAPPALAAQQLGLSLHSISDCLESNPAFAERWQRVQELLSQNVASALYRLAMEGNVTAQTFYLKHRPPADWQASAADPLSQSPDEMADDELLAQFQREAPLLLAQLAASGVASPGAE